VRALPGTAVRTGGAVHRGAEGPEGLPADGCRGAGDAPDSRDCRARGRDGHARVPGVLARSVASVPGVPRRGPRGRTTSGRANAGRGARCVVTLFDPPTERGAHARERLGPAMAACLKTGT